MPIIKFTKGYSTPDQTLLNLYPDQYVPQSEKNGDDWQKLNMDYFYNVAINQFTRNKDRYSRNYDLMNGELKRSDFEGVPEIQSFTETLLKSEDLPAYIRDYNIMTPPVNTMTGELVKRPDNVYVKAFDGDSQAEEMRFKTQILEDYITSTIQARITAMLAQQGHEVNEEQIQAMTQEEVSQEFTNYTSEAERWGARVLDFLKGQFTMLEKSADAFRDLLITAREYYHVYEDDSNIGFNVEVLNPKNEWHLTLPDEKYISDPTNKAAGAYAAGTIEIMEISEIIRKFNLTKEEVDHLKDLSQQAYLLNSKESNLVNGHAKTGIDSIQYNTYDPLVLQYRLIAESQLKENRDDLSDFLGITNNVGVFGNKYMVVRSYWCSKKKVGNLTFINMDGAEETLLVDENYKEGSHPQEVSLEWGWVNQWYQGVKIGIDIYYVKPFELLDYCPIIGSIFEGKNTEAKSLVDRMKPFQVIYNIALNQLYRLLEKDLGVVFLTSIRHVPTPRDGDPQDALEMWETEAREKGIIFIDDSPENLKAPSSFNQHQRMDLSRANEIQARRDLALWARTECWKLIGLSEQRLGESKATETATGINSALTQSYAQTEPWFAHHEYTLNRLYQAILDAAQYIESSKPASTLSYISTEGERAFIQVNGSSLKLADLGVLVTSRAEDAMNFKELRSFSQAMLQNGASPYEIAQLYSTKSIRQMKDIFKQLKDKQDQFQQQGQDLEQQKIEQQNQQFQKQQELMELQDQKNKAFEAYQAEQDRINKLKIAYIGATSKTQTPDSGPSTLDLQQFDADLQKSQADYQFKLQDLSLKQQQILSQNALASQNVSLQKDKLKMEKYKIDKQMAIAKENKQNKPKPKKK